MSPSRIALLFPVLLGSAFSGCQSLMLDQSFSSGDARSMEPAATTGDTFAIEYYPVDGQPEREQLPLKDTTYVQQVLEQSDALARFRREKIQLYRKSPQSTTYARLDVLFDRDKKRVPPESDYAIHPGDRLVIREDTSTIVDDMFGKFNKGPLGGVLQR